ncbi:DDE_3 domain-containing protein [Trichonephila clavipes]|nr:DDE_3 domain-containing protein [Trichonephila clavipes]
MVLDTLIYDQPCHGFLRDYNHNSERKNHWGEVYPIMKTLFPAGYELFLVDNAPIHATRLVKVGFDEHVDNVKHLPWPKQSSNFNINVPLWFILENSILNINPPQAFYSRTFIISP